MNTPQKEAISRIKLCLDELHELSKHCNNSEIPSEVRNRGIVIMTDLFRPESTKDATASELREKLVLLQKIHELKAENTSLYHATEPKSILSNFGSLFKRKPL